mmetsp:Transcript_23220/g.52488  ORF Transcript_23220/g.52488 Transcript_23220/m.52488 type:complete len:235 (-) Transcript_23220:12-716(-)
MHRVVGHVLAELGPQGAGGLATSLVGVGRPHEIPPLGDGHVTNQFHRQHHIAAHHPHQLLVERLSLVFRVEFRCLTLGELDQLHVTHGKPNGQHALEDDPNVVVAGGLDKTQGARPLGFTNAPCPHVPVFRDLQLPRIHGDNGANIQILLSDGRILCALEERPPILAIVHLQGVVSIKIGQLVPSDQVCLGIKPFHEEGEPVLSSVSLGRHDECWVPKESCSGSFSPALEPCCA